MSVGALIPPGSRIALLDEPVHRNIGDHLIQLGSERFFHARDVSIIARASTYSYRGWRLRKLIDPGTLIVCQGGGHLGDLYPRHQALRERVAADFPQHRIVVLPSSVHFRDPAAGRRAASAFRRHADLHLFLREQQSYRRAAEMGLGNLYLAPDMAHGLYPLDASADESALPTGTLYLLRRDKESVLTALQGMGAVSHCDWRSLTHPTDTLTLGFLAALLYLSASPDPAAPVHQLLDRKRRSLAERAIELVARHDRVVTSRLHAALLGLLLNKPVQILPSLTGKCRAYYETWLAGIEGCDLLDETRS